MISFEPFCESYTFLLYFLISCFFSKHFETVEVNIIAFEKSNIDLLNLSTYNIIGNLLKCC